MKLLGCFILLLILYNPYYISAFKFAANNPLSSFVPPDYNALRTTLLQRERANVKRLLEPIKGANIERLFEPIKGT